MNGRRPVTDPRSGQPAGSWSLLATLDEDLLVGETAVVTVQGTTRKERVRHLFATDSAYPAGTQVFVTEVQGTLRAFNGLLSGSGGGSASCDDVINDCVDRGSVTACAGLGEATRWIYGVGLELPWGYCNTPPLGAKFEHAGGCVWETLPFPCGAGEYRWRLTAGPDLPRIELVHVSGDLDPILEHVQYYGPKPLAGLCGNELWLHQSPRATFERQQAGWTKLKSRICLSVKPQDGICLDCPDGISPRYMRVKVGPGANASGAEHCADILWDLVCVTPDEEDWDSIPPAERRGCPWFGVGPCIPLDLPAAGAPGGDASGFLAIATATVGILPEVPSLSPAMLHIVVTMRWDWSAVGAPCGDNPTAYGQWGFFIQADFRMPMSEVDCFGPNQVPFHSQFQLQTNDFVTFPAFWEPAFCDFSGLTCLLEPTN